MALSSDRSEDRFNRTRREGLQTSMNTKADCISTPCHELACPPESVGGWKLWPASNQRCQYRCRNHQRRQIAALGVAALPASQVPRTKNSEAAVSRPTSVSASLSHTSLRMAFQAYSYLQCQILYGHQSSSLTSTEIARVCIHNCLVPVGCRGGPLEESR